LHKKERTMSTPATTYLEQAVAAWDFLGRQHLAALKKQFPEIDEAVIEDMLLELGTGDLVSMAGVSPEEFEAWIESCHDLESDDNPEPPPALAAFLDATDFTALALKPRSR
jgi:hypothetical protein